MEEKKEGKSRFPGTEMERVEVNPQSGSLPRDCPEKRQKLRTEGNSVTLLRITSLPWHLCVYACAHGVCVCVYVHALMYTEIEKDCCNAFSARMMVKRKQRKYKMNYKWNGHVCVGHLLRLIREKCMFRRCFNLRHWNFSVLCVVRYKIRSD